MAAPLTWRIENAPDAVRVIVDGELNDGVDLKPLLRPEKNVVLDLAGLKRMTSPGIRNWLEFVPQLCAGRSVTFERCSVVMVLQLNMIAKMRDHAEVRSVMLPYHCVYCRKD